MAAITGQITPSVGFTQTPSSGFLTGTPLGINLTLKLAFGNGTAADQCDLVHPKRYAFTASTPQTIDLTSLTDAFGAAITFARVRAVIVKVYSTTDAATLTMAPGASNGWTTGPVPSSSSVVFASATAANPDGGFNILTAPNTTGWAVDGTHKTITFTPSAHAFNVDLFIVGASA